MLSEASSDNSNTSESESETDSDSSTSSSSASSSSSSGSSSTTSLSDSSDGRNSPPPPPTSSSSSVIAGLSATTISNVPISTTTQKSNCLESKILSNSFKTSLPEPEDTNSRNDSPPSSKNLDEQLSDDHNESSMDVVNERRRSKLNQDQDLKELIDHYPDVYGIRRSSRSRKEPERFAAATQAESENSDDNRRTRKVKQKRKGSGNWDDSDESISSGSDDDSDAGSRRTRKARSASRRVTVSRSALAQKASRSLRQGSRLNKKDRTLDSSTDDSRTEEEDDDEDEEDERSRRSTRKKVSYKEQSDHTDTDDLVEVDWGDYNAEAEEEGETIEKVLESRLGKCGAVGIATTIYKVELDGDPNAGEESLDNSQKEQQFLIKWKGRSYMHNTWESEFSLKEMRAKGMKKIENYLKREEEIQHWRKHSSPEDVEYYDCQEEMAYQLRMTHCYIERVITHQKVKVEEKEEEQIEYLCKFEGLPYSECTWEAEELIKQKFQRKIDDYYSRNKSQKIPCRNSKVLRHRPKFIPLKQQPDYIGGRDHFQLRDYQLDGLNWLAHSWCKENSVILADEMGLGKTIQTIGFFNYLSESHGLYGPFLMVVPLSTMTAWQKEFELWAPDLNFIVYIGDVNSRNMIRTYEWCHLNSKKLKFNVLLTTYEILLKDRSFLGSVSWSVLGVDEAHRLKNDDSLLYKSLFEFDTNHRVLITGTPLQNSLRELWALLHFIMPEKFSTWEEFENEYKDCDTKGYSKLHKRLEPYLLRRVKKDVEKSLPAKVEQILRVEMTAIQKQYYKWILTKNFPALSKGMKGSFSGFANIMMELKKCCNHASLVRPTDEINSLPPLTRIIRGGGKLVLLDKLLVRLKETGHRVLIFSQMVRMLDILSDYLTYRRFAFQRLDGSIKGELRKQALDHFNAENSQDFCFLLSTRAGGLGINLATADTVIIFDSDWNPQNDLQAQARAHRIGQKNQVNIYRLVTKSSVEEDIIERAKRKMVLDHLVIQRMDTTGRTVLSKSIGTSNSSNSNPFTKEELSQILKFGAEELFKEGDVGEEEPQVDIDEILKRAETREEPSATPSDELLGAFKVASFNFNEEDVNAIHTQSTKEEKGWEEIIPEEDRQKLEEEEKEKVEFLPPRSSRKATQQNSTNQSDSEEEYDPTNRDNSEDSDGEARSGRRRGRAKRENGKETLKGFSEQELRRFIKSYKKFATPMKRLESIAMDAELQEKPMADLKYVAELIQSGCENAIREHEERLAQDNLADDGQVAKKRLRGLNFKLHGVTVFPRNIISCQQELEPLEKILPSSPEERKKWVLDLKVKDVKDWDVNWTIEDDSKLLAGIYEYGVGSWESIKMDPSYSLADKILPDGDLKPQAKQLQCRVEQLLKAIQKFVYAQKFIEEVKKPRKRQLKASKIADPNATEPPLTNNENDSSAAKVLKSVKSRSKSKEVNEDNGKTSKKSKENKSKTLNDKDKRNKAKDHKKKKKRKRDLNAPAMHFTANAEPQIIDGDLPPKIFEQCKEKMRPVKKSLKQLDNPDRHLSKAEQNEQVESCLLKIGRRITECLEEISDVDMSKEWRNNLWTFVSKFTEYNPKKLYRLYKHTLRKHENSKESSSSANHTNTSNSSSVLSLANQHLTTTSSTVRHGHPVKYPLPVFSSSSNLSSTRHSPYAPGLSSIKDNYNYGGEKRPNSSVQSPVKRSRMDEHAGSRDARNDSHGRSLEPSLRIDSLKLDSNRNDNSTRATDSQSRRPANWHSSSSYDNQERYRPYTNRSSHSNDKYHSDNRPRYANRPAYGPSPQKPSSPFYQNSHLKPPNSNHSHHHHHPSPPSFGSPFNSTQRDNRSSDWSV